MISAVLLGVIAVELGIIAWNTKKVKFRTVKIPSVVLNASKGKENTKLKDIF